MGNIQSSFKQKGIKYAAKVQDVIHQKHAMFK